MYIYIYIICIYKSTFSPTPHSFSLLFPSISSCFRRNKCSVWVPQCIATSSGKSEAWPACPPSIVSMACRAWISGSAPHAHLTHLAIICSPIPLPKIRPVAANWNTNFIFNFSLYPSVDDWLNPVAGFLSVASCGVLWHFSSFLLPQQSGGVPCWLYLENEGSSSCSSTGRVSGRTAGS